MDWIWIIRKVSDWIRIAKFPYPYTRGVRSLKLLTLTPLLFQQNILRLCCDSETFKVLDSESCLNSKVNYLKAVAIDTHVDLEI